MQALGGFGCFDGKLFEPHRRIDEITKDEPGRVCLTVEKHCGRFIEQCLGKCRVTLDALDDRLLEVAGECHSFTSCVSIWRRLFSAPCIPPTSLSPVRYRFADAPSSFSVPLI